VADSIAIAKVRHVSGRTSSLIFKSYDQGREKWQGDTIDWLWLDEEPPEAIYFEGLTRTNATGGMTLMTFTPLLGMTEVVRRFLLEKPADCHVTSMTIHDAEHYTPEQREAIIAAYPEHEREARAKGIPILGSGRVFPIVEDAIKVRSFPIPPHWPRLVGLDFGVHAGGAAADFETAGEDAFGMEAAVHGVFHNAPDALDAFAHGLFGAQGGLVGQHQSGDWDLIVQ
jgi:phage terminase large subunit-like protein